MIESALNESHRRTVEDMIFDTSLRLCSLTNAKLFVLIESVDGNRRCCGTDELVEAYVKNLLFPLDGEKEMRYRYDHSLLAERTLPARQPNKTNGAAVPLDGENVNGAAVPSAKDDVTGGGKKKDVSGPQKRKRSSTGGTEKEQEEVWHFVEKGEGLWRLKLFDDEANPNQPAAKTAKPTKTSPTKPAQKTSSSSARKTTASPKNDDANKKDKKASVEKSGKRTIGSASKAPKRTNESSHGRVVKRRSIASVPPKLRKSTGEPSSSDLNVSGELVPYVDPDLHNAALSMKAEFTSLDELNGDGRERNEEPERGESSANPNRFDEDAEAASSKGGNLNDSSLFNGDEYVDSDPPWDPEVHAAPSTSSGSTQEFRDLFDLPSYSALVDSADDPNKPSMSVVEGEDEIIAAYRATFSPSDGGDPRHHYPLVELGWTRELVLRATAGDEKKKKADSYYISPCGKKFRMWSQVFAFLAETGVENLAQENFTFAAKLVGAPFNESLRLSGGIRRLLSE